MSGSMKVSSTAADVDVPRLLRLRRGTRVQIRSDGLIQVGCDPVRRALLPDTNAVRGTLHLLDRGARVSPAPGTDGVLAALREAGVLLDPETDRLLSEARSCTRVLLDVPEPWADSVSATVRTAGLTPVLRRRARTRRSEEHPTPDLTLRIEIGDGPQTTGTATAGRPAASTGGSTGEDVPTLHLRVEDARIRVGPFSSPGATACPECVEMHLRDRDPHRPVLVPGPDRSLLPCGAGDVDEVDPVLLQFALVTAVNDLRAWAEGHQPRTWSATLWVERNLRTQQRAWSQHPRCGCSWSAG
ncbi:hypothetical protein [Nocardioides yefusunii]|uniref:TOMM leader peptide-binding protein n=1 Tax=Nocardioides yefusunii TaxID=2500546 RepID=A0ABW1QY65_9ACTN|nr:hypothetical protein [Nocardioides yefusunii]